ncbi:hypothetical protein, partial [Rickettsiella grylli]|uniref:hypothetical protein n=1 Tax=Rickettsiella grylli TaxID=59196 RepID=UPI000A49A780
VYPKTQFVASLTINLSGVVLYTYLLTWAIHSCFTVLGAIHLALIFSSPIATGLLILIFSSIFLMNHLFEFLSRETFYQRAILTRINEKCEYHYKDKYGKERVIQLEKWKKFEYLKDNISFLESEFKIFFKENNLIYAHNKFYDLFDTYLKKNIFKGGAPDKIPAESSTTTRIKKIVNRFFALSGGSFYGYSLSQQIIAQNKWGLHFFIQSCTFPFKLLFLPLIILNGFANLITYHLHHRQCNRFEMAKNLDNKLEILEQTNKKLLYLATLLSLEIKRLSTPIMKPVPLEKRLKTHLLKEMGHFSFFSEKLKTKTISEIKLPHIDVKVA